MKEKLLWTTWLGCKSQASAASRAYWLFMFMFSTASTACFTWGWDLSNVIGASYRNLPIPKDSIILSSLHWCKMEWRSLTQNAQQLALWRKFQMWTASGFSTSEELGSRKTHEKHIGHGANISLKFSSCLPKHCQRQLWIRYPIWIREFIIYTMRMEYNYWQPKDPTGRVEQHPCAYLSCWWLKITHHRFHWQLSSSPRFACAMAMFDLSPLHTPFFSEFLMVFSHPTAVDQSSVDRKPSIPCLPCLVLEAAQITR